MIRWGSSMGIMQMTVLTRFCSKIEKVQFYETEIQIDHPIQVRRLDLPVDITVLAAMCN